MDDDSECSSCDEPIKEEHVSRATVILYGDIASKMKARLLHQALSTGEDEETAKSESVGLASTSGQFLTWASRHKLPYKFSLLKGDIFIKEIPTLPHGNASVKINSEFLAQDPNEDHIIVAGDYDLPSSIDPDCSETPDMVILVKADHMPDYPAVVVEIGVTQDTASLFRRAGYFLGPACPTVVYYVALKRYDYRQAGDQGMVAFVYDRDTGPRTPVQIISFGTGPLHSSVWASLRRRGWHHLVLGVGLPNEGPCTSLGNPRYQIVFPAAGVFRGLPGGVPVGVPAGYTLDLYRVQGAFQKRTAAYNQLQN